MKRAGFFKRSKIKPRGRGFRKLRLESLETRQVLTCTVAVVGGVLEITDAEAGPSSIDIDILGLTGGDLDVSGTCDGEAIDFSGITDPFDTVRIRAGTGADTVNVNVNNEVDDLVVEVQGNRGADTITAGFGDLEVTAGGGFHFVALGLAGDDTISIDGSEIDVAVGGTALLEAFGGDENDIATVIAPDSPVDGSGIDVTLSGGPGVDELNFDAFPEFVSGSALDGDIEVSVEGGRGDDDVLLDLRDIDIASTGFLGVTLDTEDDNDEVTVLAGENEVAGTLALSLRLGTGDDSLTFDIDLVEILDGALVDLDIFGGRGADTIVVTADVDGSEDIELAGDFIADIDGGRDTDSATANVDDVNVRSTATFTIEGFRIEDTEFNPGDDITIEFGATVFVDLNGNGINDFLE